MSVRAPAATLRTLLGDGSTALGTFIKLPSTEVLDVVVAAGFDFAIADLEHSQLDYPVVRRLAGHATARGFPLLIRLPAVDSGAINRLLEAGAAGIQLSMLRSTGQRRALLDAARYPPDGKRSISLAHPQAGYGAFGMAEYLDTQRPGPFLVGQIETPDGEDPVADMIRGLDVVFIGTADLSLNAGHPGDPRHPDVAARIAEVAVAAGETGTVLGGWVDSARSLGVLTDLGARFLVVGSDLQLLRSSLQGLVDEVRAGETS